MYLKPDICVLEQKKKHLNLILYSLRLHSQALTKIGGYQLIPVSTIP